MSETEFPKAALVETGAFGIDRARALEKLRDFQIEHPEEFYRDLVRAGVHSKAEWIRVEPGDSFRISFDGRPLTYGTLEDPFSSLISGDNPATERDKALAYGILAALRLGPERITVESGRGRDRRLLVIGSVDKMKNEDPGVDEGCTIITVDWSNKRRGLSLAKENELLEVLGMMKPRLIFVEGRNDWQHASRLLEQRKDVSESFGKEWNAFAAPSKMAAGRLFLYKDGIRVGGEVPTPMDMRALDLFLEVPKSQIDISRASLVKTPAIKNAISNAYQWADHEFPLISGFSWRRLWIENRYDFDLGIGFS
ncbi:MAG: hypothetical protein COB53_12340 [Elusimicrobia bacterium]|nr:MAG: hypothetical protein COB53_12340 [Elusimicrobiota bacterium]